MTRMSITSTNIMTSSKTKTNKTKTVQPQTTVDKSLTTKKDKVVSEPLTTTNDVLSGYDLSKLPPPSQPKVSQKTICEELAKLGYKSKQVSEITNIKLTNVSWYFAKFGLNKIANEALMAQSELAKK